MFEVADSSNANPKIVKSSKTLALCAEYKKIVVIGFLAELEKDLKTTVNYLQKNIPKGIDKIYFSGETGNILTKKLSSQLCVEFVVRRKKIT